MTEGMTFTINDIPPSDPNGADDPIVSDDPSCVVCGTPLAYGGRGRKPKYCEEHKAQGSSTPRASSGRRSPRDVEAAMAALASIHTSLEFGMMIVAGDAALAFSAQRDALDLRNRGILEADPKLAKRLATAASKGGGPALVLSHLIAIAPAAGITFSKIKDGRAARRAEEETYPQGVDNVVDFGVNPDAAFIR